MVHGQVPGPPLEARVVVDAVLRDGTVGVSEVPHDGVGESSGSPDRSDRVVDEPLLHVGPGTRVVRAFLLGGCAQVRAPALAQPSGEVLFGPLPAAVRLQGLLVLRAEPLPEPPRAQGGEDRQPRDDRGSSDNDDHGRDDDDDRSGLHGGYLLTSLCPRVPGAKRHVPCWGRLGPLTAGPEPDWSDTP